MPDDLKKIADEAAAAAKRGDHLAAVRHYRELARAADGELNAAIRRAHRAGVTLAQIGEAAGGISRQAIFKRLT